jgi:hypothetical protein
MTFGFIQIYKIEKNILEPDGLKTLEEWKILFTPNEEYVNNNIYINNISGIKNKTQSMNIIDTFRLDLNKLHFIFMHARDRNLTANIKNGQLYVIGDSQKVLLIQELPVEYEIDTIPITLKANHNFLNKHGLPLF